MQTLNNYKIPKRCKLCGEQGELGGASICSQCLTIKPIWHQCILPLDYAGVPKQMIQAFKFHQHKRFGSILSRLLTKEIIRHATYGALPDALIAIPSHPRRLKARGFSTSLKIATHLSRTLDIPLIEPFERLSSPKPQATLNRKDRLQNVKGSFKLVSHWRKLIPAAQLAHLCLVDDVITTGATFTECATMLNTLGLYRLDVWALAKTPRAGDA